MEGAPLSEVIDCWLPTGMIGHIQINDPNRRGSGRGTLIFAPIFSALLRNGYTGDISIEPMEYVPDGPGSAARAIGYVRGILETLADGVRTAATCVRANAGRATWERCRATVRFCELPLTANPVFAGLLRARDLL